LSEGHGIALIEAPVVVQRSVARVAFISTLRHDDDDWRRPHSYSIRHTDRPQVAVAADSTWHTSFRGVPPREHSDIPFTSHKTQLDQLTQSYYLHTQYSQYTVQVQSHKERGDLPPSVQHLSDRLRACHYSILRDRQSATWLQDPSVPESYIILLQSQTPSGELRILWGTVHYIR
jgi:hypothetical protein